MKHSLKPICSSEPSPQTSSSVSGNVLFYHPHRRLKNEALLGLRQNSLPFTHLDLEKNNDHFPKFLSRL